MIGSSYLKKRALYATSILQAATSIAAERLPAVDSGHLSLGSAEQQFIQ